MASFSNNVKVTNFQLKSVEPMYSNQSWTGQRIIRSTGIQYYQIGLTLNFNPTSLSEVNAFLAQYSQGKPFTVTLGVAGVYHGQQAGALTATAPAAKGTRVITTNSNQMAIGEMIQFSNHNKLYKIIDRTATSLTIFPVLQNTVQTSEIIRYDNLIVEAVLDPDNDYTMPVGNLMTLNLKATENIV
uniref:hypothetical protein n=1 Tax=Rahnella sp. RFA10(1/100) TaxID=2511202 RepID=UPI0010203246|nr:hypothetical protein [Rahnella sp. RFA10(1/100)]